MRYVVSSDLNKSIRSILKDIDHNNDPQPVLYINGTLPQRLFTLVNEGEYQFKHDHLKMQAFNYQKVSQLADILTLLDHQHDHPHQTVIIEDLQQIIDLTILDYNNLNALLVDVLTQVRRRYDGVVIDLRYNQFIDLCCDEYVNL